MLWIHMRLSLARAFPCIIKVSCGYNNSFFVEVDEFGLSGVYIGAKKLFENKVYLVWKCELGRIWE